MKIQTRNFIKGFTLIEMLIVIAIIGIIAGIQLTSFGDSRQGAELESSQAVVLHALETARQRAVFGVGDTSHGVQVNPQEVILFEDDPLTGTVFPLSPNTLTDQSGTDIIFDRISGDTPLGEIITITHDNGDSETVEVYQDGFIQ